MPFTTNRSGGTDSPRRPASRFDPSAAGMYNGAGLSVCFIQDKHLTERGVNMSSAKSRGQLEAQITTAITQFEREHLGRGPHEVRTWIIQDLILIRLKGVLTPAEERLARDPEGHHLVKEIRKRLIEGSRALLEEMIQDITGVPVVSLHSDISVKTGERIIVFTLADDLNARFKR